jgi:hypothetical protein
MSRQTLEKPTALTMKNVIYYCDYSPVAADMDGERLYRISLRFAERKGALLFS